jgi:uncharacterized protein YwlG (UPF0340 family)
MSPNQIQHDATVDVADRFAGRHLKVVQINFSHEMPLETLEMN